MMMTATKQLLHPSTIRYFSNLIHRVELAVERQSLNLTQQSHAQVICRNLHQNPFIITKLITSYSNCKSPRLGEMVFSSVLENNVFLWNTLISGYVRNCEYDYVFDLFGKMCLGSGCCPDDFTFSMICKAAGEIGDLGLGECVYGRCVKAGVVLDVVVANSIMSMYLKCGEFGGTLKVFNEMPVRGLGSWNVVVNGHVMLGQEGESCGMVSRLFRMMTEDGVRPNAFTLSSVLPMCGKSGHGREIHCFIVKSGDLALDVHLGCALVDLYSRNGKVLNARLVFDRMECRNVFAWTAMINGYVSNEWCDEAVILFKEMQIRDGIQPNSVSLVSILPTCSLRAGLIVGKQIHGYSVRRTLNSSTSLANALIDMYFKCGSICYAQLVFQDENFCKDSISWSSMISGYGSHGRGEVAVSSFNKMLRQGIKLDMITLVGVLSACSRSGLVKEGLEIYNMAKNEHGMKPSFEICACMVDMLGRAGQLKEALDFVQRMPVKPGPSVWGALINSCIAHGSSEMLELAYGVLIRMEPENPSNYVSLSNICALSRKWDVVARVRTMMKDKGLRKNPGFSWIDINNQTHHFAVADKQHRCSGLIYEMLDYLTSMMKRDNTDSDLFNMT